MRVLVKDIMSKGVLKLKKDQTIKEVNQLFLARVIDGAPVVDEDGKVIGIFTKTHLMRAFNMPLDTPIGSLMNKNVLSIGETMPAEEAMNIPVGRLPVVDKSGKMVGWLTRTDIAAAFFDKYQKSLGGLMELIDSMAHGIVAIDLNGRITVFNETAEQLWGVKAERVLGLPVGEAFPVMNMESLLESGEPLSLKLQVNGVLYNIEMRQIKTGRQIKGVVASFYKSAE